MPTRNLQEVCYPVRQDRVKDLPERETGQKSVPCCISAPTVCHTLLFTFHWWKEVREGAGGGR